MLAAMRGIAMAPALAIVLPIALASGGRAAAEPAESTDTTEAAQLFLRGRELLKQGRRAEACELFENSYKIDPALGTGVNLAVCLEQKGQLRQAWELFDKVARSSPNVQSRVQLARQRADALVKRLAIVIIKLGDPRPAGLAIRLGERELTILPGADQIREVVEPGYVELVATAPGQPELKTTVNAIAGAEVWADVPPLAALRVQTRRSHRAIGLAGGLGAAGVASLGISLGFALAARRAQDDAFDHGCTHTSRGVVCTGPADGVNQGGRLIHLAGARADLATGFAIGGAVLFGAAATVFAISRESVQVAPIAAHHALGIDLVARF
jgi:hypothetical protein